MKIEQIAKILIGENLTSFNNNIVDGSMEISQLLTDSRNHFLPEETLFFAISTPGGNDGHRFIGNLYEKGVRNFVVEKIPEDFHGLKNSNIFIVQDSKEALAKIGKAHRDNAKEIVAITGSRGKTTLKEILFALLESSKKISRSPRSFNSKIGVPLSLWQIPPETEIALIEAGISRKGEMEYLSEIIQPDTVILTNIGDAHSQGFETLQEKALEKARLISGDNVKTVVYPMDDEPLQEAVNLILSEKEKGHVDSDCYKEKSSNINSIGWSEVNPSAELFIRKKGKTIEYKWRGETFSIEVPDLEEHYLGNIVEALAFLLIEGFKSEDIEEKFRNLKKIKTRLNVSEGVNGCSVIMDSYTSDLSSLLPAIDFMSRRSMPTQTKTLIMSDLHYEGKSAESTYKEMARIIKDTGISKFIGIGDNLMRYARLFPENSKIYPDSKSFVNDFSISDFNDEIILIKGDGSKDFNEILEQLEARKHETVMEINLDGLIRNYNYFRSHIPAATGIIAMVKASGYGTGSYEIAKTLQDAGASYLAVAALDEGIDLRRNGIVMPVMVMNPKAANYKAMFNNRLEPAIYSMSMLKTLIKESERYGGKEYPVHIKLDTGMHRMGFQPDEIEELKDLLASAKNIKVATIFSHLATADCLDMDSYTFRQLEKFREMSDELISGLDYKPGRHILNSAGIIRFPQFHYDLVRLGIGLYGANTLPAKIEKPLSVVATLRSVIICIREISKEEAVGYSRKGKVNRPTIVATIPVGYADGINRHLGNGNLKVMVNGKLVPTIGNICMDATMLDVTEVECKEGDSVEIFGENVPIQDLADTLSTIPYEILTSISPRVKRIYYRE